MEKIDSEQIDKQNNIKEKKNKDSLSKNLKANLLRRKTAVKKQK